MFAALQKLQGMQPWTDLWSGDFERDPRSYKGFEHCLINIAAKTGAALQRVEMADHYGADYALALNRGKDAAALAVIIMSALKAANAYPGGALDIAGAIKSDLTRRGVLDNDHGS